MRTRRLRTFAGIPCWVVSFLLAGCQAPRPLAPADVKTATERADMTDAARGVAEAALGKQAEVLAQGDLAQNGREQLLVINRYSTGVAVSGKEANPSMIFVTRAAILEQNDGKWSEVLLCDEHLKNPNGYLGGTLAARVNRWRLEFAQRPKDGLEIKFSPAEGFDGAHGDLDRSSEAKRPIFEVRWNKNAKRYQSFDQSHERYLSEVPSLETPESTLK